MPPKILLLMAIVLGIALSASNSNGQCVIADFSTTAPPGATGIAGESLPIQIHQDLLVVGNHRGNEVLPSAGRVHLYQLVGELLTPITELTAPSPGGFDRFGRSVAVAEDLIVVGMDGDDDPLADAGSAFIFEKIGGIWQQTYQCFPPDPVQFGAFGSTAAIVGDTVAIGAYKATGPDTRSGRVYIYRKNQLGDWEFDRILDGSDTEFGSEFGRSLASSGNRLLVGAPEATSLNPMANGAVYVFSYDGVSDWTEETKLLADDGEAGDRFGIAVDIDGHDVVVGASNDSHSELDRQGSAYVYRFDNGVWSQTAKLIDSASEDLDAFGSAVAIDYPRIMVGSPFADAISNDDGSSTLFWHLNGNWERTTTITRDQTGHDGNFGWSLELQGSLAFVTAPTESPWSVYLIDLFSNAEDCNVNGYPDPCEPDCNSNDIPDACDITDLTSTDCDANGIPDECEPDCNLNGITDACDIASGFSNDCDDNGVPDDCQPDCNANSIADVCDLRDGASSDCDDNGIPDECETDCNGNGLLDECADILSTYEQLLPPSPPQSGAFGYSVAADNGFLVVGEPNNSDMDFLAGAAHVYEVNAGSSTFVTTLYADVVDERDQFGESVAIHQDTVAVGITRGSVFTDRLGSVFLFRRVGSAWNQIAELRPPDGDEGVSFSFGFAVAIHGDTVVVGAPGDSTGDLTNAGVVFVFRETSGVWTQIQRLTPADHTIQSQFGLSCSFDGNTIAVGAPFRSSFGNISGAVFTYEEIDGVWQQTAQLNTPLPTSNNFGANFGKSVSVDGDRLIVGAPGFSVQGSSATTTGAAFIFRRVAGEWELESHLGSNFNIFWRFFGSSVLIKGDRAFATAQSMGVMFPVPASPRPGFSAFQLIDEQWRATSNVRVQTANAFTADQSLTITDSTLIAGLSSTPGGPDNVNSRGLVVLNDLDVATDCNNNLIPDDCELAGNDCNQNGLPDDCDTAIGDCNQNGIPDDCEIANCPVDDLSCQDCNGDGIPNICEPDCNADGVPDACELADCPDGQSDCGDCNLNGIPDGCDPDCNADGIPDTCEVPNSYDVLFAEDVGTLGEFGVAIGLDGPNMIVGARRFDRSPINGEASGAATVYEFVDNRWQYHSTIVPPAATTYSFFGDGIVIEGNEAIIGALRRDGEDAVDAYLVYERVENAWTLTDEIVLPAASFGFSAAAGLRSIDIDNGTIVVGVSGDSTFGNAAGTAFVYRKENDRWTQVARLVSSSPGESRQFGYSVAIDGDTIVVGALFDFEDDIQCGTATVFREIDGFWTEIARLVPSDPRIIGRFGKSVDIDDGVVVVKSVAFPGAIEWIPTVYVFEEADGAWDQTGYFRTTTGTLGAPLSNRDVAVENGTIVFGLPEYRVPGVFPNTRIGTALVLRKTDGQWRWAGNLISKFPFSNSYIGASVAMQGNTVALGAPGTPLSAATVAGAVHMMQVNDVFPDCDGNKISDLCDDSDCLSPNAPCSACGRSDLLRTCYDMFQNCDGDGNDGLCGTIPIERLSEFAQALVVDSKDYQDLCFFDIDHNGFINGRDIQPVIERLLP